MHRLRIVAFVALIAVFYSQEPAPAAQAVGEAVRIKTDVTGQSGPIVVNGPVHRDEQIRTSKSGLGQFVFRDGTKLAVGWGSSVVIDKFVYDDSNQLKQLTVKAAKGTFRWVSGNSKSSAYKILTPAGTIGVRGTAFDFYVGANGTTAVVLLNGQAQFCGPGGCRQLTRRCDCVVATPGGAMTDAKRVNRGVLRTLGEPRALPFLSGSQPLSLGMGVVGGGGCGLDTAFQDRQDNNGDPTEQPQRAAPQRSDPAPSAPAPREAPSVPDRPSPPNPPDDPDPPSEPEKPHKPHKPGKDWGDWHGHHHKGDRDRDRDGWSGRDRHREGGWDRTRD